MIDCLNYTVYIRERFFCIVYFKKKTSRTSQSCSSMSPDRAD